LVAHAGAVTTLRTGAVTGVATDLLAPGDASRLVMIGTGAQAPDQIRAVLAVRPVDHITIVGRDGARAERRAAELTSELGANVRVVASHDVAEALASADVVCCATTAETPLFSLDDLPDQVHVNAIGSYRPAMRELPDDLLEVGLVVVDERAAILEESGEILHAIAAGAIAADDMVELGAALTDGVERTQRTSFKSVGVAVQDWAVARLLADAFLT
jgi:ornithine cyclodeaminase